MKRKIVVLLLLMSIVLTGCQKKVALDNKYNGGEEEFTKYDDTNFQFWEGGMNAPTSFTVYHKEDITLFKGMSVSASGVMPIFELDLEEDKDLELSIYSKIIDGRAKLALLNSEGEVLEEVDLLDIDETKQFSLAKGEYSIVVVADRALFDIVNITTAGRIEI